MVRRQFLIGFILVAVAVPAFARSPVPIVDFKDQAIVLAGGKTSTAAQVRDAIIQAAASLGWTLAPEGESKFVATLVVRNKHTVVTDVTFSPEKFSVVYKSSINMKYDVKDGVPVVHPFYNEWAKKFVDAIRAELNKT
jgi:hypothetical protein